MKRISISKWLLMLLISVQISCKKNEIVNSIGNNKLITFTADYISPDSLVAIFDYKDKGIVFNCYGKKDNSNNIEYINAVSFYRANSTDTIYNFTMNNNVVTSYYKTIKGVKDTLIAKYNLQDSIMIISVYNINWSSNSFILRDIARVNMNSSLVNLSHFRTLGPINDIIKLAIGTAITAGGLEIIAIGAAIYVTAPSIIAIGVGLVGLSAIYGASVLTRPGLVLIGNTILDAIQNAISIQNSNVSSEYEESENPFTALAELENNNANFNKKICYVSYDIYSHPYTVNDDFLPTATQFEWGIRVEYTDASLSDCDDTYSYTTVVRKGYYFEIGPVHDFSITTISAENCPGSTALYKTFHFKY